MDRSVLPATAVLCDDAQLLVQRVDGGDEATEGGSVRDQNGERVAAEDGEHVETGGPEDLPLHGTRFEYCECPVCVAGVGGTVPRVCDYGNFRVTPGANDAGVWSSDVPEELDGLVYATHHSGLRFLLSAAQIRFVNVQYDHGGGRSKAGVCAKGPVVCGTGGWWAIKCVNVNINVNVTKVRDC